jgi:hypothetical protein
MIELLVEHGGDPARDAALLRALAAHEQAVLCSAGRGDTGQVRIAERAVAADPAAGFSFDDSGAATLTAGGHHWSAGRFQPATIGELRARTAAPGSGRLRLLLIDGGSAPTDIGSLQAHAGERTLFQVASQFNCLEAPGPHLTPVARYLSDPTQGPRASISAFPGTLLRHYAAPASDGTRFAQADDGRQIELLGEVCHPTIARVRNGYLLEDEITDPPAFLDTLERRFDRIRVGVHDDVQVVLGHDWAGAVERDPPPRIAQVFTSTLAAGGYGALSTPLVDVCRRLLEAAYLGTLLSALALDRSRVVLTLIGGGVFGNPIPLIWESILWALDQIEPLAHQDLTVIVNGRDLTRHLDRNALQRAAHARGGLLVSWPRSAAPTLHR